MKTIAIHQPNFFPWLGYFDKIARSDVFIFLDDVQFPKTGGIWMNRVKLLVSGEGRWVTAAIDRNFHGIRNINEMHFSSNAPWRTSMLKSIEANYRKHPFYDETMEIIVPLITSEETNIAIYNCHAITTLAKKIGIDTDKFRLSSQMQKNGVSNELLATLTLSAGGGTYMCGGGADGYQDESIFSCHGIVLKHQQFQHPVYPQARTSSFTPGLSIIDAAMNLGWLGVKSILTSNS